VGGDDQSGSLLACVFKQGMYDFVGMIAIKACRRLVGQKK